MKKWIPVLISRKRHEQYIDQTNVLKYLNVVFMSITTNRNGVGQIPGHKIHLCSDLITEVLTGNIKKAGRNGAQAGKKWWSKIKPKLDL